MRHVRTLVAAAVVLLLPGAVRAQAPDGEGLYSRNCARCHDGGADRAPNREAFRSMTPDRVLAAMETGAMITMANNRTAAERRAIAEFLSGKSFSNPLV